MVDVLSTRTHARDQFYLNATRPEQVGFLADQGTHLRQAGSQIGMVAPSARRGTVVPNQSNMSPRLGH